MKIKISYKPQYLSAPQAYASVLELELINNQIQGKLDIEYLGRHELSTEEIISQGFTEHDDYSWEGKLDSNWSPVVSSISDWKLDNVPDEDIYLHLSISDKVEGFPVDIQHANMIFQELVQAILETDNLEGPLSIKIEIDDKQYFLQWSFSSLTLQVDNKNLAWKNGREILNKLYSIDFERINPMKKPKGPCFSQVPGEWYPINKQFVNSLRAILE